jgi:CRP-like cAMP-binding protein
MMPVAPDELEALRRIPFFGDFSAVHLEALAAQAESRSLPEKLLLFDEGQLLHSAYAVISGTLRAERKPKGGGEPVRREIGAGVLLGERALILDTRASESVRVENRARVLQIRKANFRKLLQDFPELAVALRARLSRTVMQAAADYSDVARRLGAMQG